MREFTSGSFRERILRISASAHSMNGMRRSERTVLIARNSTVSKVILKILGRSAAVLREGRMKMMIRSIVEIPIRKNRKSSGNGSPKRMGMRRMKKRIFARKIHAIRRWFIRCFFYVVSRFPRGHLSWLGLKSVVRGVRWPRGA